LRILAHGPRAYLGDIWLSLAREGHDVCVFCEDPEPQRSFRGLIEPVADWREQLPWLGRDGVIVFERPENAALQDELRAEGYRVIGTSRFGARLEMDRAFGQRILAEAGLAVAEARPFATPAEAFDWLRANPCRCVLKHDDVGRTTFVGTHPRGEDVLFILRRAEGPVLLMEHLDGIEVGVGAYFDGSRFLRPACVDFEHKRFFPGDLGEMTGEMGTLATYEGGEALFEATLGRLEGQFARAGHVGYVNLNLIVDRRGPRPLEFTCRFGNPGFAVLAALQPAGWGDLFRRMAEGGHGSFPTLPGWSVAIVLTIPPFPASIEEPAPEEDPPVFFLAPPDPAHHHHVDVRMEDGLLLARRRSGHISIVTGTGPTVADTREAAARRARNVVVPELRWRADIGERFLAGEGARLASLGWLGADLVRRAAA
jgi:phosphoribosylamine--glycine ligase